MLSRQWLWISYPSKMILFTPAIIVLFAVQVVHSAFDTFSKGYTPVIIDSRVHCKFDRNFNVTLQSISNCCEVELRCLEYDEYGELAVDAPENKITLGKTIAVAYFSFIFQRRTSSKHKENQWLEGGRQDSSGDYLCSGSQWRRRYPNLGKQWRFSHRNGKNYNAIPSE